MMVIDICWKLTMVTINPPGLLSILISLVVLFHWDLADSAIKGLFRYFADEQKTTRYFWAKPASEKPPLLKASASKL